MAKQCSGSSDSSNSATSSPSHRKVKSGCKTCKRRRVKCDESRPACHRCQSTGRVCDGYGIWGGGSFASDSQSTYPGKKSGIRSNLGLANAAQSNIARPIQLATLEANENECLEWFMRRSAVKLPGLFAAHQWTTLLFQASITEPAVRHAVLALSSAHKEEVRGFGSLGRESNDEQTMFTIMQYSKAINSVQPCFTDCRRMSVHVTLISCVLFVLTEFLRGHYTNGLLHLEYGLGLLSMRTAGLEYREPLFTYIDGWLLTMFTRHLVQAKLLGQLAGFSSQEFLGLEPQVKCEIFRSVHHARRGLDHLMLRALDLQETSRQLASKTTKEYDAALYDHNRMRTDLHGWFQTYKASVANLSSEICTLEHFAYGLLGLYYHLAVVLVGTCLEVANELRFDQYDSVFLQIISYCIETYKIIYPNGKRNPKGHHDPEPSSPNSISDIGWIAPLYFTAIKCRNHRIRHQALKLLQSSTHKEGIWNATLAIVVARKVMEIEEGNYYNCMENVHDFQKLDLPVEKDLASPILPIGFRLGNIRIGLPDDNDGKLMLRCYRLQCNGGVEWISKEFDLCTRKWTGKTRITQNMAVS